MVDIDIVKDIEELISGLLGIQRLNSAQRNAHPSASLINITMNITAKSLDDSIKGEIRDRLYQSNEGKLPLVDVIETKDNVRIIATLPGIKAEDVWYEVNNNVLTVEITKYGQIVKKEIQCKSAPKKITLKSSTVNNSVLELVFDKV